MNQTLQATLSAPVWGKIDIIKHLLGQINVNCIIVGCSLNEIEESGEWREWNEAESFYEFTKDAFNLGRTTTYYLQEIGKQFRLYLEEYPEIVRQIPYTRLTELLPVFKKLNAPAAKDDWLYKAATLPVDGWKDTLREEKGKVTSDACGHEEREKWERCKCCGKWILVV